MSKPVLKEIRKGYYKYSKGDISISLVGDPTSFYLNYEDKFTKMVTSDWFKGRSTLYHCLLRCDDKVDAVKALKEQCFNNSK